MAEKQRWGQTKVHRQVQNIHQLPQTAPLREHDLRFTPRRPPSCCTVAKEDSIGLVVRRWIQCSAQCQAGLG
jgi:hypothetical protein